MEEKELVQELASSVDAVKEAENPDNSDAARLKEVEAAIETLEAVAESLPKEEAAAGIQHPTTPNGNPPW
jgi:hypothetical protein